MCEPKEQVTTTYFLVDDESGEEFPIDLQHWWPGKVFADEENCLFSKGEIKRALRKNKEFGGKVNNNYMTVAVCVTPTKTYRRLSRCMGIDQPRRRYGRDHAIGLLHQKALEDGYRLRVDQDIEYG